MLAVTLCLLAAGCAAGEAGGDGSTGPVTSTTAASAYPDPPEAPDTPTPQATAAFTAIVASVEATGSTTDGLDELVEAGDARHAWLVSDLLRFTSDPADLDPLVAAFEALTGVDPTGHPSHAGSPWVNITNHLMVWDLPAPPDYRAMKQQLFTIVEPRWEPFFADTDSAMDWRWVSWGGVLIDDRSLGNDLPCMRGCIPALDDPELTDASGGAWYPDDAIVFGIALGGEVVALPKNIMEVHEMVNMTVGGHRLGIPYCTLCGSAQAFFTDGAAADGIVLRTSGLLNRSNKVMFDLNTMSVFDTFTGAAVSGPLHDQGVTLEQTTVTATTWGEWKAAHPDTGIIAEDGGIGRTYPLDPLRGRDDAGPIFPIGEADPRLPVQTKVVGIVTGDGTAVAFAADDARTLLAGGEQVTHGGVTLADDGGGLRAADASGAELPAHEAFWFAWSQFHPDTELWTAP